MRVYEILKYHVDGSTALPMIPLDWLRGDLSMRGLGSFDIIPMSSLFWPNMAHIISYPWVISIHKELRLRLSHAWNWRSVKFVKNSTAALGKLVENIGCSSFSKESNSVRYFLIEAKELEVLIVWPPWKEKAELWAKSYESFRTD